jgi:hypothetical protein
VGAALNTPVAEVSVSSLQEPAVCAFQTSSDPGISVQISQLPLSGGPDKGRSLASIKDKLKGDAAESQKDGLTYRVTERPDWGTDAFSVLLYNANKPVGVEVWTPRYSSVISDDSGQLSDSAYDGEATSLGDALVKASK